jgi:hypothetical protein
VSNRVLHTQLLNDEDIDSLKFRLKKANIIDSLANLKNTGAITEDEFSVQLGKIISIEQSEDDDDEDEDEDKDKEIDASSGIGYLFRTFINAIVFYFQICALLGLIALFFYIWNLKQGQQ